MRDPHCYVLIHGILSRRLVLEMKVDRAYWSVVAITCGPHPLYACSFSVVFGLQQASQRPSRPRKRCNIACAAWLVGIALTT